MTRLRSLDVSCAAILHVLEPFLKTTIGGIVGLALLYRATGSLCASTFVEWHVFISSRCFIGTGSSDGQH